MEITNDFLNAIFSQYGLWGIAAVVGLVVLYKFSQSETFTRDSYAKMQNAMSELVLKSNETIRQQDSQLDKMQDKIYEMVEERRGFQTRIDALEAKCNKLEQTVTSLQQELVIAQHDRDTAMNENHQLRISKGKEELP